MIDDERGTGNSRQLSGVTEWKLGIGDLVLDASPEELISLADNMGKRVALEQVASWMKSVTCPDIRIIFGGRAVTVDGSESLFSAVKGCDSPYRGGLAEQVIGLLSEELLVGRIGGCVGILLSLVYKSGLSGYPSEKERAIYNQSELQELIGMSYVDESKREESVGSRTQKVEGVLNKSVLERIKEVLEKPSDEKEVVLGRVSSVVGGWGIETVKVRYEVLSELLNYFEALVSTYIRCNKRENMRYVKLDVVNELVNAYALREVLKRYIGWG